jgi:uncharacterized phiE125 gp8 family phage protein
MKSILVTPPTEEPVTLAELKAHAAVSHSQDDALLTILLRAAREAVEAHAGLLLMPQVWDVYLSGEAELPLHPIRSVVSVEAQFGAVLPETPAAPVATTFFLDPMSGWLSIEAVPDSVRYVARVEAGFEDATLVPDRAKAGILMTAADLYANRERNITGASVVLNSTAEFLLYPLRHNLGV